MQNAENLQRVFCGMMMRNNKCEMVGEMRNAGGRESNKSTISVGILPNLTLSRARLCAYNQT